METILQCFNIYLQIEGHVYVYDTLKSQYRNRNRQITDDVSVTLFCRKFLYSVKMRFLISGKNCQQDTQRAGPSSPPQAVEIESENILQSPESYQIEVGYENEEHRKEHVLLLRKLKVWFENESLDGAESIRNELRTQYVHMERVNRVCIPPNFDRTILFTKKEIKLAYYLIAASFI